MVEVNQTSGLSQSTVFANLLNYDPTKPVGIVTKKKEDVVYDPAGSRASEGACFSAGKSKFGKFVDWKKDPTSILGRETDFFREKYCFGKVEMTKWAVWAGGAVASIALFLVVLKR